MTILKLLFLPFVIVGRLVAAVFKFIIVTEVMIAAVSLLALLVVAYLLFSGDHELLQRALNILHVKT